MRLATNMLSIIIMWLWFSMNNYYATAAHVGVSLLLFCCVLLMLVHSNYHMSIYLC